MRDPQNLATFIRSRVYGKTDRPTKRALDHIRFDKFKEYVGICRDNPHFGE